jgi:hypothetical protein
MLEEEDNRCKLTVVASSDDKPKGTRAEGGGEQCMLDALFVVNGTESE